MAGSDETSSSQNQGNFLELDELLSKCDGVIILYLEVMKGKRSRDLTTFGQSPEQSCRLSFAEAGSQQTRGRVCGNVQTGNREGCIHGHGPPPIWGPLTSSPGSSATRSVLHAFGHNDPRAPETLSQ